MSVRILLLVVALGALSGCVRELQGLECDESNDCLSGFVCDFGINICVPADGCVVDEDCGPDAVCDQGACVSGDPGPVCAGESEQCAVAGECCAGLECSGELCARPGECSLADESCLEQPCCGALVCGADNLCVDNAPPCTDVGGLCAGDGDCCVNLLCGDDDRCADAVPPACTEVDQACSLSTDCCDGLFCSPTSALCELNDGGCSVEGVDCINPGDCCSGQCGVGTTCLPNGGCFDQGTGPCGGDADCCAQFCSADRTCEATCGELDDGCAGSRDCCLGLRCDVMAGACVADTCGARDSACVGDAECCPGLGCEGNVCADGPPPAPTCGDGLINQPAEQCEPPNSNFPCSDIGRGTGTAICSATCEIDEGVSTCELPRSCGNGIVETGELCDGNTFTCFFGAEPNVRQAACYDNCLGYFEDQCCNVATEYGIAGAVLCLPLSGVPDCGDGFVDGPSESCDDGNQVSGDGCSIGCQRETGAFCNNSVAPSVCEHLLAACGDGVVGAGEDCEPPGSPTCNHLCLSRFCGDGEIDGGEQCDDSNTDDDDGCSSGCSSEACGAPLTTCALDSDCCPSLECDVARGLCRFAP